MKKLMTTFTLAALLLVGICTPFHCNHMHTEECGENGINCTHHCFEVVPYEDELSPI